MPFGGGLGMGAGHREERRWWFEFDRLGFEVQVITLNEGGLHRVRQYRQETGVDETVK